MSFKIENAVSGYSEKIVVNDISLEIKEGEFCALLGLNGCGKTTLLKSVCGLIPVKSGRVFVNGESCLEMNDKNRARLISFIPQRMSLISGLKVTDVVLMGFNPYLKLLDRPNENHRKLALDALEKLSLGDLADKEFSHLSEGYKQLVILARSLVQNTPVMLMDEPDSALDYVNKNLILNKISDVIHGEKKCGLISIHDPLSAVKHCDRLLFMKDGKIVEDITVRDSSREKLQTAFSKLYNGQSLFTWDDVFSGKHLFFTGETQVGKSTRIKEICEQYSEDEIVKLITLTRINEDSSKTVFLNGIEVGKLKDHKVVSSKPEIFDTVGVEALTLKKNTKLVVIDEIGVLEEKAEKFSKRVLELLDQNDVRVIGVVQKKSRTELARDIRFHKNVELVEIV